MGSLTLDGFGRAIRVAPIVMWLFAGCTCAGDPASNPIPTATARPASPPTVAPSQTAAPAPEPTAEIRPPAAAGMEGQAPAAVTPAADADAERKRTACEGFVAVLSGGAKDPALLDNPEVQALAAGAPDLVTCSAVLTDSAVLCTRLIPVEHGPSEMCLHMQAIFHELRTYPQGRSFLLDDVDWETFKPLRTHVPKEFDAFRDAMRSADAQKCSETGDLQSICRAYVGLDTSLCRVQGQLAKAEFENQFRKPGEPAKLKADILDEHCRTTIESRKFLAQGLKSLAASGPPRESELAKAALGQADACALYAQKAMQSCLGGAPPPAAGNASPTTPVPAAAAPGQPAPP